jgi:hypothetical protein
MAISLIETASLDTGLVAPSATTATTATTATSLTTASGSAPSYSARAWVNFNGTGTVAIRASGNVTSITDNGTGDYTVNFTTAMPDANYGVTLGVNALTDACFIKLGKSSGLAVPTTSSCPVITSNFQATLFDAPGVFVAFHR